MPKLIPVLYFITLITLSLRINDNQFDTKIGFSLKLEMRLPASCESDGAKIRFEGARL